jgi:hypothetical protein
VDVKEREADFVLTYLPGGTGGDPVPILKQPWRAAAVPRKLVDLGDVDAKLAKKDQFLQFDGSAWIPAAAAAGRTGVVIFAGVEPSSSGWFGPFVHGFGSTLVMIRLALETLNKASFEFAENTDTWLEGTALRMVVGYQPGTPDFLIQIQDARQDGKALDFRVRWYAVPVTVAEPASVRAKRVDFEKADRGPDLAKGAILAEVMAGNRLVDEILQRLQLSPDRLSQFLEALVKEERIRVEGGIITLNS